MRTFFIILFAFLFFISSAQTLGGSAAYNFLRLPSTAWLTAVGGVNISYHANEVGLASNNPALLNAQLSGQLNFGFNAFLAGIKSYSTTGAYHNEKSNTTFGGHIYFVDYGSIPQTDAAGNASGDFRPVDFVVQAEAAKKYLEKWSYGLTIKFISSSYQQYISSAVAFDMGVLYDDSSASFSASVLAKNIGFQLTAYAGEKEDLPFDLQVGFTKKLANAPFAFSVTAQHVHQFNTVYNDAGFNDDNSYSSKNSFLNKLVNHFVVASHIFISNNLEATIGYNHLRRTELNIGDSGNGLNGFSTGIRLKFQKLQVLYARSSYQRNVAYNQLGVTLQMNKLLGWSGL